MISRRKRSRNELIRRGRAVLSLVCAAWAASSASVHAQAFVHPGCLETSADFSRMTTKVVQLGQSPWLDDWNVLTANSHAQSGYVPNPQQYLVRGIGSSPCNVETYSAAMNDAAAAYQLSLRWRIDGDTSCANTAVNILNAWAGKLQEVCGDPNAALNGIYGYQFACAGENMRGYSGWASSDFARFQAMMANKFYPMSHDFLVRHDGTCPSYMWANWDLIQIADEMSIGVLCDNRAFYNDAIDYWYHGVGNGRIDWNPNTNTGTVVAEFNNNSLGEGQEEGRDQGHSGLEMSLEGVICTIAQNQGDNLFAYNSDKVASLCEYFADYNLGNSVPFVGYSNCQPDTITAISSASQGDNRPTWDLLYNQFVNRMNVSAPYSTQYATRLRPEGGGGNYGTTSGGFDQLGFTTLTSTIDSTPIPNGNYSIINLASGKALDNAGSTSAGSNVIQWTPNGNNNQSWAITYLGNGYYRLTCATSNMCLDGMGGKSNGAAAGQWTCGSTGTNQAWMIVPVGSYYKLVNETSGLCLDDDGQTGNGSTVVQWSSSNSNNQLWRFTGVSHGGSAPVITSLAGTFPYATATGTVGSGFSYTITATNSPTSYSASNLPPGLVLNTGNGVISGTPTSSGTWLATINASNSTATGTATLTMTITSPPSNPIGNGAYKIINRNSGLALDAYGAGTSNGTLLDQWPYNAQSNQQWTVTSLGGGNYEIVGVQSALAVEMNAGYLYPDLWSYGGGLNQQWSFVPAGGGYYYLEPANMSGQFALTVPGSSTSDGTLLDLEVNTGGYNQQWSVGAP